MPRRRLLVDARFQSTVIGSFLLVFVPAMLVLCAIPWGILVEVEKLGQTLELAAAHPYFEVLRQLRVAATAATVATLAGTIALAIYGGLLRTRRIAGPILAAQQRLAQAARGEPGPEVNLRRGDYFGELLRGVNAAIRPE